MPRYAAKIDGNQSDVIQWYESLGWSIINTSGAGRGFPDLVAVKLIDGKWRIILVEVKRGKYAKFTEAQKRFNEQYPGLAVRVENEDDVLRSVEDA